MRWNRVGHILSSALAVAAAILTVAGFATAGFSSAPVDTKIGFIALAILVAFAIAGLIWQQARYSRQARFAEVLPNIHQASKGYWNPDLSTRQACEDFMK